MTPLTLAVLSTAGLLITAAPRRYALAAFLAGIFYLTQTQGIWLGGLNLYGLRVLEVFTFIRVLARQEFSFRALIAIDRLLIALMLYTAAVYCLRSSEGQLFQIGYAIDAYLCYFSFRGLLQTEDDYIWILRAMALILLPYAVVVLYESYTSNNLFSTLGGRGPSADRYRGGRLRACGTFRHPSILGSIGAALFAMYLAPAITRTTRYWGIAGVLAGGALVWASNSGGPAGSVIIAVACWVGWPLRHRMRKVRWVLCLLLVACAVLMKAPVWYLLTKVSSVSGGGGYHRSKLMDQAFKHLDEWWFVGMPIEQTRPWFPYFVSSTGGADITNQFLKFGLTAGIGAMFLLFILVWQVYKRIGDSIALTAENDLQFSAQKRILWSVGVAVTVHQFSWLGISYFDQSAAFWYATLAIAVAVTRPATDDTSTSLEYKWPQDCLEGRA